MTDRRVLIKAVARPYQIKKKKQRLRVWTKVEIQKNRMIKLAEFLRK